MVDRTFSCDQCSYTGQRKTSFQHICPFCGFNSKTDKFTDVFDLILRQSRRQKLIPFTEEHIKEYLDGAIRVWRKRKNDARLLSEGPSNAAVTMAECYINAFQSVRITLFGELLKEDK